jgi:hypothetical protein
MLEDTRQCGGATWNGNMVKRKALKDAFMDTATYGGRFYFR